MRRRNPFVALAAILFATPLAAQTAPAPAPSAGQPPATIIAEPLAVLIAGCDRNGDALVTRTELSACLAATFTTADPTHSGSIGYIGYSDWAQTWLGDRNALPSPFEVDANGDNRITLSELQARFDTIFTRLDRDRDGKLSRAELLTIRTGVGTAADSPRLRRRGQ